MAATAEIMPLPHGPLPHKLWQRDPAPRDQGRGRWACAIVRPTRHATHDLAVGPHFHEPRRPSATSIATTEGAVEEAGGTHKKKQVLKPCEGTTPSLQFQGTEPLRIFGNIPLRGWPYPATPDDPQTKRLKNDRLIPSHYILRTKHMVIWWDLTPNWE